MVERISKRQTATDSLDAIFGALSDPTRRRVLGLLRDAAVSGVDELRVGDIAAAFEMSLNGVSKHLKVLERAELVRRRVDGRTHFIRAESASLDQARDWIDAQRNFWNTRLDALDALADDLVLEAKQDPDESTT